MFIIGVTGNIGTGKSTVSEMLAGYGAKVLSADKISRRLLWKNSPCFPKIVRAFGRGILKGGSINRSRLAAIVFNDRRTLKQLEAILHPEVKKEIMRRIERIKKRPGFSCVVLDVPLLFESGLHRDVDFTVVVNTKKDFRLKRSMRRLALTQSQILLRDQRQMPLEDKCRLADYIINNNGTIKQTKDKVKTLWQKVQQMEKKPKKKNLR
ncbi:MAG: dephospho-CoA kinase [Candidatus Omnitrophica bacterium]|nr:dephospho-CoA kinase [Candidatus Omnitrophota bacterium]